jgi:hypothetical protein
MTTAIRMRVAAFGTSRRAACGFRQVGRFGGLLLLCVWLAFAAPGCGKSSTAKTPTDQPAAAADADEKAEAPAEKPPVKIEKKPAVPVPVVRRRPKDPMKWELADLQTGLAAHDLRFVPAVLVFSVQNPNGAKQAEELQALLERAGQLKDDPSITLPLTQPPASAQAAASQPAAGPAATPPAKPSGFSKRPRRLGGFGGSRAPQ